MRINKFLAKNTRLSRRKADGAVLAGRVSINGRKADLGTSVEATDSVSLDGTLVAHREEPLGLYMLNKPAGYVCSRQGQGALTIYNLLPAELQNLKSVGRLDKESSGLLLLTDDGDLLNELSHPSRGHEKTYEVTLDKPLMPEHKIKIESGVDIGDPTNSRFAINNLKPSNNFMPSTKIVAILQEGRNRQIRRTFEAMNYKVTSLQRTSFGSYQIANLPTGKFIKVE